MEKERNEFCETLVAPPMALELVWTGERITEIRMSWAAGDAREDLRTEVGRQMALALARYVAGEDPEWPEAPLDLDRLAPFQRRVLETLAACPRGRTLSYGELAALAGRPGAARAVGRAMATNPFPIVLPCHRVLGASGKLTGFGGGLDMKRYLLELEGAL